MMSKATWGDVEKHDVVELGGRRWRVVKIKRKGKKAHVMVEFKGRYHESDVKLKDRVTIAQRGESSKRGPLHDERGQAQRWATKREAEEVLGKGGASLAIGDSAQTKPPAKPGPDVWETPHGKVERLLGDLLSARLVGETPDESAGYYVPPVNVTTVAAHLALFHGGIPEAVSDDEGKMLAAHEAQHAEALRGAPLAVNHWHTATRPKTS